MKLSSDQQDINKKKYLQVLGPSLKVGYPWPSFDSLSHRILIHQSQYKNDRLGGSNSIQLVLSYEGQNLRTAISRSALSLDPCLATDHRLLSSSLGFVFPCAYLVSVVKLPFTEKPVRLEQDLPIGPDLTLIIFLKNVSLNTDIA